MTTLNKGQVRLFLALIDTTNDKGTNAAKRKAQVVRALAEPAEYEPSVQMNTFAMCYDPAIRDEEIEVSLTLPEATAIAEEAKALICAGQAGFALRALHGLLDAIKGE